MIDIFTSPRRPMSPFANAHRLTGFHSIRLTITLQGLNGVPQLACRELNEEMENLIFDKYGT